MAPPVSAWLLPELLWPLRRRLIMAAVLESTARRLRLRSRSLDIITRDPRAVLRELISTIIVVRRRLLRDRDYRLTSRRAMIRTMALRMIPITTTINLADS